MPRREKPGFSISGNLAKLCLGRAIPCPQLVIAVDTARGGDCVAFLFHNEG
jgi:hypothetical protein